MTQPTEQVTYFCTVCRRQFQLVPKPGVAYNCPKDKARLNPIPVAPQLNPSPGYRYEQKEVVAGQIVIDVPIASGNQAPDGKKIFQLRNAIFRAREIAVTCSEIANGQRPESKELFARWFHNSGHKDSTHGKARPDLGRRVREVFLNVMQALESRHITFAMATPVNAFALDDPNSPAFAWPPGLNQIKSKQTAAQESTSERNFKQAVSGLPSFCAGSGIRIILTEKFFADEPTVQASTIIHELTHKTSNTLDLCYGPWQCHDLAILAPYKAVENADSYTFFAEQAMGHQKDKVFSWQGNTVPPNKGYSKEGF